MARWKPLRLKEDVVDDVDLAAFLVIAAQQAAFRTVSSISHIFAPGPICRIVVEWLDNDNNFVVDGRGSFSIQFIEANFEVTEGGFLSTPTVILYDSIVMEGGVGFRPILTPDMKHVELGTLRFSDVNPPVGATKMRALYKEV
jgi:hypothetical protein